MAPGYIPRRITDFYNLRSRWVASKPFQPRGGTPASHSQHGFSKVPPPSERGRGEPVTTATDVRVDYRSKRRGRGSRRVVARAKRFSRAVLKVTDKRESSVKCMFTPTVNAATASAGTQGFIFDGGLMLGTYNNSVASERDLLQISTALGDTATSVTNIRLKSAMLEVSLLNANAYDTYVEIFTIKPRKASPATSASLSANFVLGLAAEPPVLSATGVGIASYGMSPFMNQQFTKSFKILKKETIKLSGGASTNLMLKTSLRGFFNRRENIGTITVDQRSLGFMLVFYGPPDATTGVASASKIAYNAVKTYVVESPRSLGLPTSYQVLAP